MNSVRVDGRDTAPSGNAMIFLQRPLLSRGAPMKRAVVSVLPGWWAPFLVLLLSITRLVDYASRSDAA